MFIFFTILFCILFSQAAGALDGPVVILKSSNIDAYAKAVSGVEETLNGHSALTYNLYGDPNRIPHTMEKVALVSPKAIVAVGSLSILALKTVPIEAPIVFCMVVDHTEGLILPRSWGISMQIPPNGAYDRIKHVFPKGAIGVLYNPNRLGELTTDLFQFFEDQPIQLIPITVYSSTDINYALEQSDSQLDALWILPDPSFLDALSIKYLFKYSMSHKLPLLGYSESFTRSGALFSIQSDFMEMGRQAAETVLQIVSGKNPPRIQHPRDLKTFINLEVAKRLNILIGQKVIALSERIYP